MGVGAPRSAGGRSQGRGGTPRRVALGVPGVAARIDAMPERARVRLLITGLVQGVAFRQSAVFEAERLGLAGWVKNLPDGRVATDRKSTRLNSSHQLISYAVFCLKKKNKKKALREIEGKTMIETRDEGNGSSS